MEQKPINKNQIESQITRSQNSMLLRFRSSYYQALLRVMKKDQFATHRAKFAPIFGIIFAWTVFFPNSGIPCDMVLFILCHRFFFRFAFRRISGWDGWREREKKTYIIDKLAKQQYNDEL